ncbi:MULTISPECIES: HD domain-containing phosphohydrolase [Enterococcus]|uniref:PAS domain S-box protein n=1 Tax=Candidatus Enterococcus willemsii TaxID=1857215 RepID=A0ABQ6YXR1_9ENTE|nr:MULTISPECIES: HD domain-containing phosphohydrolase [Enterococcus]KAF1302416.1 PAS domain S-box protein [Enterococcus sp. CU12B]
MARGNLIGSCYVELFMDSNGEITDFLFEEADEMFSFFVGCPMSQLTGKRASDVFKQVPNDYRNWLTLCSYALRFKKTQERTYWMAKKNQFLTVSVMPLENRAVIFLRVPNEQMADEKEKQSRDEIFRIVEPLFHSENYILSLLEFKNGQFRYIISNALHQKLIGKRVQEGQMLSEIYDGATLTMIETNLNLALTTSKPVFYEAVAHNQAFQTELTPIFSSFGIPYILSYSKDVSQNLKFKEENERLSQRLQAMFDQHSAIKLIFDSDTGQILEANTAACHFYGYTKEEFLQLNLQEINVQKVQLAHKQKNKDNVLFSALPHRKKNGEIRLLDVYSSFISYGGEEFSYCIAFDVTDREILKNKLVHEEELMRITLQSIGDGVVTTDMTGNVRTVNVAAEKITGWSKQEIIGRSFSEVFTIYDNKTKEKIDLPSGCCIDGGYDMCHLEKTATLLTKDSCWLSVALSTNLLKDARDQAQGIVIVFRDIHEETKHHQQIEFLSYHDPLTCLYNRHYLEEHFNCYSQPANFPITVVMGDVNGLKLTNDVFGHKAGDELLKEVARVFEKNCSSEHIVSRWGGDEFVVIMPKTSSKEAEQIVQAIRETPVKLANIGGVTASISLGFSTMDSTKTTLVETMSRAEEHMYHKKLLDGKSYRNSIINTLLVTLFENSTETEEHSQRLLRYCKAVGMKMDLHPRLLDDLALVCLLHDIGKVGIDPRILNKPGKLTLEEWKEMQRHTEIGYRIAQATPELAPLANLILSHHERWDGKGYPHGLKGTDIPLICRILAIADTYDAMTNNRVYRKSVSHEKAIAEIKANAGTQFDPTIAAIFIELFE